MVDWPGDNGSVHYTGPLFLSLYLKSVPCITQTTLQKKSIYVKLESQMNASHKGCFGHREARIDFVLLCQ